MATKPLAIKKIVIFFRIIITIIPAVWKHRHNEYMDVGVFWTNNERKWLRYKELRQQIGWIIEPPTRDL